MDAPNDKTGVSDKAFKFNSWRLRQIMERWQRGLLRRIANAEAP